MPINSYVDGNKLSSDALIMLSAAGVTQHSELVDKKIKRPNTDLAVLRNRNDHERPLSLQKVVRLTRSPRQK